MAPVHGSSTLLLTLAVIVIIRILRARQKRMISNPKGLPLPPGPSRLPLIGNALDMPWDYFWLTFAEWSKKYGDIIYANVFGKRLLILNSAEVALDLLEKRSVTYSNRPHLPMFELMDYVDWNITVMEYGPTWRLHRKTFNQSFNQSASTKFVKILTYDARRCLMNILNGPEGFMGHIRYYFSSSILNIVYGIQTKSRNDPYLNLAEEMVEGGVIAGIPGAFLIDMLPILKYVPEWFPGAKFQKFARYYRGIQAAFRDRPFKAVQDAMSSGNYKPSVVSELLINHDKVARTEEDSHSVIKDIAAITFAAGSDTTVSTLQTFVLVMALYPEVQQRLYTEIVQVIGQDRLPELHEIENIPYLHAVIKETLRWQPVVPLCLPHCNQEDDEYRGYHIPKDCIIMPNIWGILHDEKVYFRPFSFNPERFLSSDGSPRDDILDPRNFVFGLGRRICPGRHHAYNGALILAASLATAFEIKQNSDCPLPKFSENAEDITRLLMKNGLVTCPKPFKCDFVLRSEVISKQLMESMVHRSDHAKPGGVEVEVAETKVWTPTMRRNSD